MMDDVECSLCGGECGVMGQLGRLEHLVCRDCGMWFQREVEEEPDTLIIGHLERGEV